MELFPNEKAHLLFKEDIEKWLREAHTICPIELVCAPENEGIIRYEFSEWHTYSLTLINDSRYALN